MNNIEDFVYGKNKVERVTAIDVDNDVATLRTLTGDVKVKNEFFALHHELLSDDMLTLEGDLHYKFAKKFNSYQSFQEHVGRCKAMDIDTYAIYNPKESFLVKTGVTFYKGMTPKDLRVLSFDIETEGLDPKNNKVLMISNSFRAENGIIERTLFTLDEFNSEKEMIYAWVSYVNKCDPHVMLGHNIFSFDLNFLKQRAGSLRIGRGSTEARFAKRPSFCKKHKNQKYEYKDVTLRGREIVDTFHLAIKYDVPGNYRTYRLKDIIKYEGLERANRQHFNFEEKSTRQIYKEFLEGNVEQWEKFKKYCVDDSDDALALFDLMIPAYFYFVQSVPRTLQQVVSSGRSNGNQINAFLVRAYLADKHSIPKASEKIKYEGAISFGNPGIYKYVGKVDVASLYPSIILQEKIYDRQKDPKGYFFKMVEYFTAERLSNKRLAKESGDRRYKDIEQAQKIIINSAYGFLNATGLNFNSPLNAADVTRHGRIILERGLEWVRSRGWQVVNADTDSFSFATGNRFPPGVFKEWIKELNSLFPDKIRWEDDGMYTTFVVLKAKNYIIQDAKTGDVKIKGNSLKATNKEPALKKFIDDVVELLLQNKPENVVVLYDIMARECLKVKDMSQWVTKKTITKNLMTKMRANERNVREAYQRAKLSVQEGDKIYTYFKSDGTVSVLEMFDGDYAADRLLKKLHSTVKAFENVVDMKQFRKYGNKRELIKFRKELEWNFTDTSKNLTNTVTSSQSDSTVTELTQ